MEVLQWARFEGCYWNASTCEAAAGGGIWRCCNGPVRRDVIGMKRYVRRQRGVGIWMCYDRLARKDVRGMSIHVRRQLVMDIWRCCDGHAPTDASGMAIRVRRQRRGVI